VRVRGIGLDAEHSLKVFFLIRQPTLPVVADGNVSFLQVLAIPIDPPSDPGAAPQVKTTLGT